MMLALAVATAGYAAAVPGADISQAPCSAEQGAKLAQQFCRTPALSCDCAGCALPDWIPLKSGPGTPQWRCYSPTALNANHTAYKSGPDYCSENDKILQILKTCTLPPAPPPPVGTAVFQPGMKVGSTGETIHTFRIPSLLRVGQTDTLLAFAEGRKFSGSDYGPKALCMRSSPDLGKTFGPLVALVNHGNASFMNPNAIWDDHTQAVILQFTYIQCNLDCKGGGDCCDDKFLGHEAPSLFQVVSTDGGKSFSAPVSLDDELGVPGLTMGPGIGIQIPSTGKLLAMGKGYATNDLFSNHDVVIASDDNGKHWRTAHIFNGTDGAGLDEPQLALLPNGHVMANMRTSSTRSTCKCRAVSLSTDQGESFGPVSSDATLISPVCQGSLLAGQHSVWFGNPANKAARADFTVRKSVDNGQTWGQSKLVSATPGCGYSSLQFLDSNESTVGFLWEADSQCTIRFVPVTL